MPIQVRVEVVGSTSLLGRQLEQYKRRAERLLDEAAKKLKAKLAAEPKEQHIPWNPVGGPPPAFVTHRQQAFVVLSVHEGTMDAPYQRTHKLAEAWKIEKEVRPTQIIETIGNDTPQFSQYIYDRDKQVYRAKEVKWPTVQGVAENDWPPLAAEIIGELDRFGR